MAFAQVSAPFWRLAYRRRLARGKEDPARLHERMARNLAPRPEGRLIWVHALSVGESLSLLALFRELLCRHDDLTIVLTTNTKTSVEALAKTGLPNRVIHQFIPADAKGPVRRFLDHWRPDLVAFSELDLWPCLLHETKRRGLPLAMINGRVTDRTWAKRARSGGLMARMLAGFDLVLAQDDTGAERLAALGADGARTRAVGSLKSAADPLPDQPDQREALAARLGKRPLWLALSTSIREEDQLIEAHALARKAAPDLLLILAPRHIREAETSQALALERFTHVARRSHGTMPDRETEVYIVDTLGEVGLWARLAPVTFMGHSMPVSDPVLTGKNPYEPLVLGSAVLHGPGRANFRAIYEQLGREGATLQVATIPDLARQILRLQDPAARAPMQKAAERHLQTARQPLVETADHLSRLLPQKSAMGCNPKDLGAEDG